MLVYSSDVIGDYNGVVEYLDKMTVKYNHYSISFTYDLVINESGYVVIIKLANVGQGV